MNESKTSIQPSSGGGSAEQMFFRLWAFFEKHLRASPEQLCLLTIWTVHTHCYSAFGVTPYLNICSREKQSGKTLCLELLDMVCNNAWYATGVSPAALTRAIVGSHLTVLLDECQTIFGGSDKQVRGLLVSGARKSKTYTAGGKTASDLIDVFCPKAFAGMPILPPAVDDRSIPIVLHAPRPGQSFSRFNSSQASAEAAPLLPWLRRWAEQNIQALHEAVPFTRDQFPPDLTPREQDLLEPLLHCADLIGGKSPEHIRNSLLGVLRQNTTRRCFLHLLSDIRHIFTNEHQHRCPTSILLDYLNSDESRPWRTWHNGGPMNPVDLALILDPHGIKPRSIRMDAHSTPKGY